MQQLVKQARQLLAAREELTQACVEGTVGGGLVRVTASGSGEITALSETTMGPLTQGMGGQLGLSGRPGM